MNDMKYKNNNKKLFVGYSVSVFNSLKELLPF